MTNESDLPRPESVLFFEQAIIKHDKVISLEKIDDYHYCLNLTNSRSYKVYLTNIYTVGLADVVELSTTFELDAIVTMSMWNSYSLDAKKYGQDIGVGVFIFRELMGAINFEKPEEYYSDIIDGKKVYEGAGYRG